MIDAELVEDRDQHADVIVARVNAIRRRASQSKSRQVEADHAPLVFQSLRPALPGVKGGTGPMHKHDRALVLFRPFVAQMNLHACNVEEC